MHLCRASSDEHALFFKSPNLANKQLHTNAVNVSNFCDKHLCKLMHVNGVNETLAKKAGDNLAIVDEENLLRMPCVLGRPVWTFFLVSWTQGWQSLGRQWNWNYFSIGNI